MYEELAALLLDIEREDLVLVVVQAVTRVEAEVALVQRTRNVQVAIRVVANDSVFKNEGSLV